MPERKPHLCNMDVVAESVAIVFAKKNKIRGRKIITFTSLALKFRSDLADLIESNSRRSHVYVEDSAIEDRSKMA